MATIVGRLLATIGVDLRDFSKGLRAAGTQLNGITRNFNTVAKSSRSLQGSLGLLRTAVIGAVGAQVLRNVASLADGFTNLQNRLRVVTSGTGELATVTDRLQRISTETRSAIESNAELFTRLSLATRELGTSQETLFTVTQGLNQAIKLSGASAAEASAGLIQLSQGIASGALRGDELRSVLEQLPVVADVIAKSLGATRGELRDLGKDGKITADVIIRAFTEAAGDLAKTFGQTVPTIADVFVLLRNTVIEFVGEFGNQINELVAFVVEIVAALREWLQTEIELDNGTKELIVTITAATAVLAPLGLAIAATTTALTLLLSTALIPMAAILAPIGVAIALIVEEFQKFRKETDSLGVTLRKFFAFLEKKLAEVQANLAQMALNLVDAYGGILNAVGLLSDEAFAAILSDIRDFRDEADRTARRLDDYIRTVSEAGLETERLAKETERLARAQRTIGPPIPSRFTQGDIGPPIPERFFPAGPPIPPGGIGDGNFLGPPNIEEGVQTLRTAAQSLRTLFADIGNAALETGNIISTTFRGMFDGLGEQLDLNALQWAEWRASIQITAIDAANAILGVFDSLAAGIGDAVARALIYQQSLSEGLVEALKQTAAQLISTLIQLGLQWVLASIIGTSAAQQLAGSRIGGALAAQFAEIVSSFATIPFGLGIPAGLSVAAGAVAATAAGAASAGAIGQGVGVIAAAAQGGVFSRPTLAIVGEGREPEGVAPFSKFEELMAGAGGGGVTVIIELDGRQVAQRTIEHMPDVVRMQGIFV